jgi:hypothetical protein
VLLHELFQLLLLELGEGIDLSRYGVWGVGLEFDGVVPDPWFWEALRGLLAKDLVMSLVAGRYRVLGGVLLRGTWPFDSCYENWVSFSLGRCGGSGKESGLGCIRASYDNRELGMIEPSSEPVDFRLDSGEPWVS